MRTRTGLLSIAMILATTAMAMAGPFSSTSSRRDQTDCSDIVLQAATGVPGERDHAYKLAGTCRWLAKYYSDGDHHRTDEVGRAFMQIDALWDGSDNELKEKATLEGSTTGSVDSTFKCGRDPYIYATTCTLTAHSNSTDWPQLSDNPDKGIPIGAGKTDLAEASAVSTSRAANAPPPPAPPPPAAPPAQAPTPQDTTVRAMQPPSTSDLRMKDGATTLTRPDNSGTAAVPHTQEAGSVISSAGIGALTVPRAFSMEGEVVATGDATPQDMGPFGDGWSDDTHLFWRAREPGESLVLTLNNLAAGRYRMALQMTTAPDYGVVQVVVNGQPTEAIFNGYHRDVAPSGAIDVGEIGITAGENLIELFVIGKDRRSTAHFVGVDRIDLEPVSVP